MPREQVPSHLFQPIGPYSHAVCMGDQVFVSGTPGVDPLTGQLAGETAYAQAHQALRNVLACVEAAGGGEQDIATVQVHLVNVDDFAEMNRAYVELFSEPYPARTVMGIAALPKPGALLTVSAIAVVAESKWRDSPST